MSVSIPVFWKLLGESRLLTAEQCKKLSSDFVKEKGAAQQETAKSLGEWLVSRKVLSRYQTAILLAGRSGPFYYGDYKVYDRVGKGRLTGAFRAVHGPTRHPVMLQFLTGPIIQDPNLWAAAVHETLAATAINSPFVQRYFEPVDLQTFKFLVAEDVRGSGVDDRLQHGRFQPAEAARLIRMAAMGLAHMHQMGRVHGDIRPTNLLLETSTPNHPGHIKLLYEPHIPPAPINFADTDPNGRLAKMADYLAPELLQPGRMPDPLSDIYALGCTLYCLLTGNPPFAGGDMQQKFHRHATEAIRPLETFGIQGPLAQMVPFLMAKNPAVRLQSAMQIAEQLAPLVDPALVNSFPAPPPASLGNYENFVRQRLQQMAASAAPVPPPPPPPPPSQPEAASGPFPNFGQPAPIVPAAPVAPAAPFSQPAPFAPAAPMGAAVPMGTSVGVPAGVPVGQGVAVGQAVAAAPAQPALNISLSGASSGSGGGAAAAIYARRKAQKQRNMIIGGVAAVVLLAIGGIVALNFAGGSGDVDPDETIAMADDEGAMDEATDEVPPITPTTNVASPVTPAGGPPGGAAMPSSATGSGSEGPVLEVVPDDGQLLWASPTQGQPPSFRLVPLDGQVFLFARPSDMLATSEGPRVIDALGPEFAAQRTAWEQASGFKLDEVKQVLITFHPNDGKFPKVSLVVTPKDKLSREQLVQRWKQPAEAKTEQGTTYYTGPQWAFYLPDDSEDGTFLMADAEAVKEVAGTKRGSPPMMIHLERLRKSMDSDRHFSVLFRPSFLFNDDGQPLFAGEREKVRQPLEWFLGDGLEAGLVSMQFGDDFYFEMRALGSLDKDKYQLAKDLRDRLEEIPNGLLDYFVTLTPPPYWKKLSFRYPQMVGMLHQNTRVGVESEQAMVNSVLPGAAAHNLVLGGELLIASAPGAAGPVVTAAAPTGPKAIEELLAMKTTLTFDAMAFDAAMAQLQADARDLAKGSPFGNGGASEFTIKILGSPDLQLDGITQQQTVRDFKQEGKTIAEVLTALVMKANPITTVKTPDEVDQKLLWVVGPDPDNPSRQVLLITTRAASAKKNYKLPDVFVPKK